MWKCSKLPTILKAVWTTLTPLKAYGSTSYVEVFKIIHPSSSGLAHERERERDEEEEEEEVCMHVRRSAVRGWGCEGLGVCLCVPRGDPACV